MWGEFGMSKGILTAKELASYIRSKYSEFTNNSKEITPIKMQKSLYFCFGFWAGFVAKGKEDNVMPANCSEILFEDTIEAWAYGPVVPEVYFDEKNRKLFKQKSEEQKALESAIKKLSKYDFLQETIDSIINDVFEISDFKLVSISHMDKCWQNHFHAEAPKHNETIPAEEIIDEYSTKKFA